LVCCLLLRHPLLRHLLHHPLLRQMLMKPRNKAPQAATADVMTERKLKHAEAQGRYMAKQRARQEREAYSRDWLELTEAEQAVASCFGFTNCELWEDRVNRSAHVASLLRGTRLTCRVISGCCPGPT